MAVENTPARIGKSVVIRGEVKGSEDLFVDGRIEGTISLSESRLTIGPNAVLAADLTARDVLVLGQVQGNIVASGRVELRAGCQMTGDVRALCASTIKRTPAPSKNAMPKPSLCSSARVAKPVKLNITSVGVLAFMPSSWHMAATR